MSGSVAGDPTLTVATSNSPSIYGSAVTFTATISSGPTGTVTFNDGNASIGTGTISGTTATLTTSSLTAGSHTITASWPGNSTYGAVTSNAITQVVSQATPTITWNNPTAIAYGTALSSTQLDASSTIPGTVVYSPSAGTVLPVGLQTLSVTFTPTDTTDYKAVTATVTLTVNASAATPTITWANPAAITYGTALSSTQLDASSPVAGTFAYTPAAGTVLKAGLQTLSVTFTPTDITDYTTATATVTLTVNQAAPAITWATPAAITYGTALSATQLDASSTVAGAFVYSPAAGVILAAGSHTLSVTFTPTDTTDYKTATATVSLAVNQGTTTQTITWADPAAITYGTALSSTQLDASSTVAGTFAYSPAAGTVLKVGLQTLSVTFTPTDTTDYKVETASVSLIVNQAASTITWATPAAITYGTALSATQLDASSTVAGTFAYTPAAGTVLKAGSQTLSVTFTPTDTTDYKSATAAVSLTVNQAKPAITWPTPAAITSGTALSATQLDANSTVAGTFVYSPAAGTVPAAGSQTLSVTFTPTDTTDYTTATATVSLTVNSATYVLTINATSVGFGDVVVGTPMTQSVTLTNTGTGSVTVSSATVITLTGTGFSLASPFSATTLTAGQIATLNVQFDPTTAAAATGTLTVISNSTTNGTAVIPLSGTGTAASYSVDLSWDAPASSPVPVAGYNVYRAPSGSSTYTFLGSPVGTATTYVDSNVTAGLTYDYEVASVDSSGVESAPTSPFPITIP
ncbi:MAG: Ig-like domain repeat protein [Terracidiphilus sp.]